jgi:hypothetical protein
MNFHESFRASPRTQEPTSELNAVVQLLEEFLSSALQCFHLLLQLVCLAFSFGRLLKKMTNNLLKIRIH